MPLRIEQRPLRPPRTELIRLRKEMQKRMGWIAPVFALQLGVTRTHLHNVEQGRRDPSAALVVKWLKLLPEATLDMFGDVPGFAVCREVVRRLDEAAQVDKAA